MFSRFYQKHIIDKPKLVILLLFLCLIGFGYYAKDFKLDASSDTLLIEGDPDLKYLREITERYGAKDFLVLTFTPKDPITSENSINNLLRLKTEMDAGHGGKSGRDGAIEEIALDYAFALKISKKI